MNLRPFRAAQLHGGFKQLAFRPLVQPIRTFSAKSEGFKSLIREYGTIAVATYFTLSTSVFVVILSSIYLLGINEQHVASLFSTIKAALGISKPASNSENQTETDKEDNHDSAKENYLISLLPEFAKNPTTIRLLTNTLLAMAITKLFLPIKIAITAAIVPSIARRLRSMGFTLAQPGGLREAVRETGERIRHHSSKH